MKKLRKGNMDNVLVWSHNKMAQAERFKRHVFLTVIFKNHRPLVSFKIFVN